MTNIYYLINHFLGKYKVSQNISTAKIRGKAIHFLPKTKKFWWLSLPVKPGIYYYRNNEKKYYICRTPIGLLFPSLYRLRLEPRVELVPHPIRWVFGCFMVLWVFLAIIPVTFFAFKDSLLGFIGGGFWVLCVLILYFVFDLDKKIALRGFASYSK